jgi:Tfp pilus assembly protein PilF
MTALAMVETVDPELGAALAAVAVVPCAATHLRLAEAYRTARILDQAHEHLTLTVQMDPANARAYDGLARIWRDWGLPHLALPDAHRAVYNAPSSPEAHNTFGTVLHALGLRREARAEYEKALELAPRAAYALNNLCALDLADGSAAAAARRCEEALRLDPGLSVAFRNLEQARAILRADILEAADGRD